MYTGWARVIAPANTLRVSKVSWSFGMVVYCFQRIFSGLVRGSNGCPEASSGTTCPSMVVKLLFTWSGVKVKLPSGATDPMGSIMSWAMSEVSRLLNR